ncbi:MAG: hypothetical protein KDD66_07505 [Bdellovibrionales bacterium]|nr:hypothetical protein [Bdellovibrionales bacterium]
MRLAKFKCQSGATTNEAAVLIGMLAMLIVPLVSLQQNLSGAFYGAAFNMNREIQLASNGGADGQRQAGGSNSGSEEEQSGGGGGGGNNTKVDGLAAHEGGGSTETVGNALPNGDGPTFY